MFISLIAAASNNNVIGKNSKLPWHMPNDLRFFKRLTLHHPIIMGRRTFTSIGCRPLPKRTNIVLSRRKNLTSNHPNVFIVSSLTKALQKASDSNPKEAFIIGGEQIYRQAMPVAQRIYLTRIQTVVQNGDAFFPNIDINIWQQKWQKSHEADEQHAFDYTFTLWERKQEHHSFSDR